MSPGRPAAPVGADRDVVLLSVPADGAYLGVLRTAAAGLAARLHFTLDEIEDLRIAVDEACAMLIGSATSATVLRCRFAVNEADPGAQLGVELAVAVGQGAALPATSSINWRMLAALTSAVHADVTAGTATIGLTARHSAPG